MQALVIVVGQVEPDSIWLCMYSDAAWAVQAEGRSSRKGRLAMPLRLAMAIMVCQAG
ncbi:hypothetical protein D3C80_2163380 [compost metagenome]